MVHQRALRSCLFLLLSLSFLAHWSAPAMAGETYQLIGRISYGEKGFSRDNPPLILLQGMKNPFAAHTRADPAGDFKFKKLRPDMFTLIVYVAFAGEHRQTVEVSPGLADSKKRVFVEVAFQPNRSRKTLQEVSSSQLSVSVKAIKELEKAFKRLEKRDREGAVAHLKKSVEISPQFIEGWNTLGTMAYQSGKYELAERYFREALEHDPESYAPMVNLGGALLSQGKIRESLPWNMAAVESRPDDALAHSQVGLSYYYLGRYREAEEHLKQAVALDPGHFSYPQLPLADIYLRNQDLKSAVRELEHFLMLHPDAEQAATVKRQVEIIYSQAGRKTVPATP